jgi:hypothetical protein
MRHDELPLFAVCRQAPNQFCHEQDACHDAFGAARGHVLATGAARAAFATSAPNAGRAHHAKSARKKRETVC